MADDSHPPERAAVPRSNPDDATHWVAGRPLGECVEQALAQYFALLDGQAPAGLYELVMSEVEAPLLRTVLAYAGDNQCRAAELLGINRGTLRKKMKRHGLL